MRHLAYRGDTLTFEKHSLQELAEKHGTPLYVYSASTILDSYHRISTAFGQAHQVCYALKANSNPSVIKLLKGAGSGADVVSGGELNLALKAGVPPGKIVFAGVGKTEAEIAMALKAGILGLNVESEMELGAVRRVAAELERPAPVSLRLNPNIDIHGHPYISTGRHNDKFGMDLETASRLFTRLRSDDNVRLIGLHIHIGSQITELTSYSEIGAVLRRMAHKAHEENHQLKYLDIGGGLGIDYHRTLEPIPDASAADNFCLEPARVASVVLERLGDLGVQLLFEPGRALVANAGVLLTRVLYKKQAAGKQFIIADAGMSELIRPSLYGAYHQIVPTVLHGRKSLNVDVVGPICESGDFLARDRSLPDVMPGEMLAVLTTGAYGFALASNYNSRPKPAEVMINEDDVRIVRPRQRLETL